MTAIEERAQRVLEEVPGFVWDGERLPVPVEDIADSHFGLHVRDVEDLRTAPGAPVLASSQGLSGLLLPASGEIWVNAAEARAGHRDGGSRSDTSWGTGACTEAAGRFGAGRTRSIRRRPRLGPPAPPTRQRSRRPTSSRPPC